MAKHRANSPDPLPSWNDSAAKQAILDFVTRVTKKGGPDFVPEHHPPFSKPDA